MREPNKSRRIGQIEIQSELISHSVPYNNNNNNIVNFFVIIIIVVELTHIGFFVFFVAESLDFQQVFPVDDRGRDGAEKKEQRQQRGRR